MTKEIQLRGNCQCCGRSQAVVRGLMSKHGYKVAEHGWFVGVCNGQDYVPMQVSRAHTDAIVAAIRKECDNLEILVAMIQRGEAFPKMAQTYEYDRKTRSYVMVPFASADKYLQERQIKSTIYSLTSRVRAGQSTAKFLEDLANAVHGTPLAEVKKAEKTTPIQIGETRLFKNGQKAKVINIDRARVCWEMAREDGRKFRGWTGTRAWRLLEAV